MIQDDKMSRRLRKWTGIALMAICATMLATLAPATGEWQVEFARICGQANMAGDLPAEQLAQLIKESDTLLVQLEKMKPEEAKVAIFRIKKNRDFFQYMLQSREGGAKESGPAE